MKKNYFVITMVIALIVNPGSFKVFSQCTIPSANSSTSPPSSFDYETKADGPWNATATWTGGNKPSTTLSGKNVKITHDVYVNNSNIILESASIIYVLNGQLTLKNGNLQLLDGSGEKFLAVHSTIETSGNIQQTSNTVFCANNVILYVGDKGDASGSPLFASGSTTTSADFQNDGGYRRLDSVCMVVTHDYDNIGEDELINVCAEIGLQNPLNASNPVGQGSGNISSSSSATSMKVYNSQFFVPNGNVQNSKTMTTCEVIFKLTNGHVENQSSSTWSGDSLHIWIAGTSSHNLENSGTWNVSVGGLCISGDIVGTFNTSLPSENCSTISSYFNDQCCANISLPVVWIYVSGERNSTGNVELKWATASELNNDFYTIERCANGMSFIEIGVVDGMGSTHQVQEYNFEDATPGKGNVYYRIKQIDYDGNYQYSKTIKISPEDTWFTYRISPNPARSVCTVSFKHNTQDTWSLILIDISGSEVIRELLPAGQKVHSVKLDHLSEGIYIVNLESPTGLLPPLRSRLVVLSW